MKGHMRNHIRVHVGLLVAIAGVFGLNAIGVAVPSVLVYLIVLACPLMMVFMMVGMSRDHDHGEAGLGGSGCHDAGSTAGPDQHRHDLAR